MLQYLIYASIYFNIYILQSIYIYIYIHIFIEGIAMEINNCRINNNRIL